MFISKGQFLIFLICNSFGFIGGTVFTIFAPVKKIFTCKYIRALFDVGIFAILCITFVLYTFLFNFPDFRGYMALGVILGLILYAESFHYILAKIGKIIYNTFSKLFQKRRTKAKKIKGIKTNERN